MGVCKYRAFIFLDQPPPWVSRTGPLRWAPSAMTESAFLGYFIHRSLDVFKMTGRCKMSFDHWIPRKYMIIEGNKEIWQQIMSPVLWFQLLWVPKEPSSTHTPPIPPLPTTRWSTPTELIHIYTQQLTDFLGAHDNEESKIGYIFRRRTLLFTS